MLFHSYYSNISNSYMEAAKIDGANFYQIYFKIMRQQASPLALTLGLMLFISKWNDYMSGVIYFQNQDYFTLQQMIQIVTQQGVNIEQLFEDQVPHRKSHSQDRHGP